jgi:hypothetical protein
MKAPSVREGSKENGTAAKIPPVSIAVRRRGRPSRIVPIASIVGSEIELD